MTSRPLGRTRGLAGWPIRRKLAALVAPPLLVILGGGTVLGLDAVDSLRDARRAQTLASTIILSGRANLALQEEINQAILGSSLAPGNTGPSPNDVARLDALIADTEETGTILEAALAKPPAGGWSADAALAAGGILQAGPELEKARESARSGRNYSFAETSYQRVLRVHLNLLGSLSRDLASATGDSRLTAAATTIAAMSGLADAASSERTEGAVLLAKAPVTPGDKVSPQSLGNYLTFISTQRVQNEIALRFASPTARTLLNEAQASDADALDLLRRDVVDLGEAIPADADSRLGKAQSFSETAGQRLSRLDRALTGMAVDTGTIARDVARAALVRTILVVGVALLALVAVTLFAASIARTVTLPLRRLRSAAVEAATVRLPAAVRQIERQGPDAVPALPPVLPAGTAAGPETIEVAQAVDGLTTEALRLATAQVRLRQAVDEAFVSMSRRSQSMVEKQLTIIDELESTEEDPDQLRNLFRLDHLAARMRRYNDNLLVLAGSTVRTRSAAPVPVADIFRAATSEMEQYERVRLQPISGTAIAGPAAGGLIHLLAELLDNAAMYSPPTSPILLTAAFMPDGGLHLEVTDSGVGIPPNELAELNARLTSPGTLDAQVPSRMGLFVVARLAQRGGLRVRLSPRSNTAGTVAEVMVPPALVAGGPSADSGAPAVFGDLPLSTAGPTSGSSNGPGGFGPGSPPAPAGPPAAPAAPLAPVAGSAQL
ncbi:MAG: sensor histidine kinase, partial [Kineosporiaceae bacterium]